MNYVAIYERLMHRAKIRRSLSRQRYERHHIKPKCLGGSNKKSNLVKLTPEEHYIAHQLLVKIHPGHKGLLWAAFAMTGTGHGVGNGRHGNKLYGWLKHQFIENQTGKPRWDDAMKRKIGEQSRARNCGEKHPMFGRHHSKKTKALLRKKRLGKVGPNKGVTFSKEHCDRLRQNKQLRKEFFLANGVPTSSGGHALYPAGQKLWKAWFKNWIKSGNKYEPMAPELREVA